MENSLEVLAKEAFKNNQGQAKAVIIALALYEIYVLGKRVVEVAKSMRQ